MKKIKVQLDFNITKRLHSLSHSFFNNPPKGVEYSVSEFKGVNKKTYSILGKIRKRLIKLFPFLEKLDQTILSIIRREKKDIDLIHFIFHLGKTKKKAIVDYETCYSFIYGDNRLDKKEKRKAISLLKKENIKYLVSIHKEALKSFNAFFRDEIKIPQKIIYPTLSIPEKNRKSVKKKKRVIFISTANIFTDSIFLIKGGLETLKAFEELSKRHPEYEFVILGKVPDKYRKKFPKNLKLIEGVPREEMWKMFNESQIFVQPCYQAPAMAFIEAMFFKLPIVTTPFWGNTEFVDNKNGLLINTLDPNHIDKNNVPNYPEEVLEKIRNNTPKNAKNIEKAIEKLINNPSLRKKLGENGFKRVTEGKFSIERRNKMLREVYEEALRN